MRNTVIGIGNFLRADDGVGIHVARMLNDEKPDFEVADLSTVNIEILELIRGRDSVVIVDAIKTGAEPGKIYRIAPKEMKMMYLVSSHSLNLYSVLKLGWELYEEEMPRKLVILAVECEDIDSYSSELTSKVQSAIPKLIDEIRKEFEETND